MQDAEEADAEIDGRIKWFDPARGFGFIISDDAPADILLRAEVLLDFGQSSVADNCRIRARVHETARGLQATEILRIEPPPKGEPAEGAGEHPEDQLAPEDIAALPLEPARVKWFDKGKGFGFANAFGRSEDVFLHVEVLRESGLADLTTGEAIALRAVLGRRGRLAVQILSWDKGVDVGTDADPGADGDDAPEDEGGASRHGDEAGPAGAPEEAPETADDPNHHAVHQT